MSHSVLKAQYLAFDKYLINQRKRLNEDAFCQHISLARYPRKENELHSSLAAWVRVLAVH